MKKVTLVVIVSLTIVFGSFASDVLNTHYTSEYSYSSTTVDRTLYEEEYDMRLFLYKDGSCVIRYSDNSTLAGTYNINGTRIRFEWGEGYRSQQGSCSFRDNVLEYVWVEGYTFKARMVVPRR